MNLTAKKNNEFLIQSEKWDTEFDNSRGWRARIGFILIQNETVIEGDMTRLTPDGVETHFVRSKMPAGCTVENLASMQSSLAETSKEFMPEFDLKVVCYACTSGSVVIGEENVEKELLKGNSNRKPTTLITGAIRALQALSAKRIVMATPYTDDINTIETRYLESKGFELLNVQGLNITYDSQITCVKPSFISKFAKSVDHPKAEAIFISCGALRTLDVIEEIEQSTGKPVVTSNQSMMWNCLRMAGIEDRLDGYGILFRDH